MGIVGYGHIGKAVAVRAAAFGMRIVAADRTAGDAPPPLDALYELGQLDTLLGESDAVVVTLPTAPETRGLIDAAKFALMKSGAVIVRCRARTGHRKEEALYNALAEKQIGGAFIDV